jgi:hypothetical protein
MLLIAPLRSMRSHRYPFHLVAVFSEWFLCATFVAFFATFYHEFSKLEISCHPQLSGHTYRLVSPGNHVF